MWGSAAGQGGPTGGRGWDAWTGRADRWAGLGCMDREGRQVGGAGMHGQGGPTGGRGSDASLHVHVCMFTSDMTAACVV